MTYNNIIVLLHLSFIYILLPQFLTHSLTIIILFKVYHFYIHIGTLGDCAGNDCWHLWVGEGFQCLGHDGWFIDIAVGYPNIPLQFLHSPGKLVRGYHPKIEDITF